jgi:hypothetical protein
MIKPRSPGTGLILEIPWCRENRSESLPIVHNQAILASISAAPSNGYRKFPTRHRQGILLTGAGNFFHPSREFMGRSKERPYSAGFMESIYW